MVTHPLSQEPAALALAGASAQAGAGGSGSNAVAVGDVVIVDKVGWGQGFVFTVESISKAGNCKLNPVKADQDPATVPYSTLVRLASESV